MLEKKALVVDDSKLALFVLEKILFDKYMKTISPKQLDDDYIKF